MISKYPFADSTRETLQQLKHETYAEIHNNSPKLAIIAEIFGSLKINESCFPQLTCI